MFFFFCEFKSIRSSLAELIKKILNTELIIR